MDFDLIYHISGIIANLTVAVTGVIVAINSNNRPTSNRGGYCCLIKD